MSLLRFKKPPTFIDAIDNSSGPQSYMFSESTVDSNLTTTLTVFFRISWRFNMHSEGKECLEGYMIHHSMSYMQSALLELRHQHLNNVSSCIYWGLLTLVAATFRLPGVYRHPCCTVLNELVEGSMVKLDGTAFTLPRETKYWLAIIYIISTGTVPRIILADSIAELRKLSWEELRQHLRQVFWISAFHDDLGQIAHEKISM